MDFDTAAFNVAGRRPLDTQNLKNASASKFVIAIFHGLQILFTLYLISCGRSFPLECQSDLECGADRQCTRFGACEARIAVCATDRECGLRYRCQNFDCVLLDTCETDPDCPPQTRCIRDVPGAATGLCQTPQRCETPCAADEYCGVDLRCIPNGYCGSDRDCHPDLSCQFGTCQRLSCSLDSECGDQRFCDDNGICRAPTLCEFDQACAAGERCQNGACRFVTSQCSDCRPDELCVSGRCIPPEPDGLN